jgi:hypothetical protein
VSRQLHSLPTVFDAVTQVDHTVTESPLVPQLEIDADVVREERIAATNDRRSDEELVLIEEPGADRLCRQAGTCDGDVEDSAFSLPNVRSMRVRALATSVSVAE